MTNQKLKHGLFLLLITGCSTAYSHDLKGKTLGPSPSATDYYKIDCFDEGNGAGDATALEITLKAPKKASPVVSAQVSTDFTLATMETKNVTDGISGDKYASRKLSIANDNNGTANGRYYLTVNKSKAGIQKYNIEYHCIGQSGHAGTSIFTIQDQ